MKNILLIILIASTFAFHASGQILDKVNVGVGMGLDYGGFGSRLTYQATSNIGLYGSLGYNLNQLGYNLGAHFKLPMSSRLDWVSTAMYGYNAVLMVDGPEGKIKTTYYGPSLGSGVHWKRATNDNYWSLELILPFRNQALSSAMDDLNLAGYSVGKMLPLSFSLGYHFKLK